MKLDLRVVKMRVRSFIGLVALLMLCFSIATASAAAPWKKADENADKGFSKAKNWFNETKKKVEEIKKKVQERREKVFEAWKNHLKAWVNMAKRWVERVQLRVENLHTGDESKQKILEQLQDAKEKLDEIEQEINESQNFTELKYTAQRIREVWIELRQELRIAVQTYAIEKYEEVLERLRQVRDRLEAAGADITELDEKIDEIDAAVADLENYAGTPEFAEKVKEINGMFREAFEIVKDLAKEVRPVYNTGFVYAYVNGSFELSGNFTSVQIKGEGDISIPDDVVVTSVDTKGVKMIVAKGSFTASGEGNFRILAHGSGELNLNGKGYYRVKESSTSSMTDEIEFEGNETVTFG